MTLIANGDQEADADALSGVLAQPRVEAWTGVTFRGPESPEWLELWLACALPNSLSRMPATPKAVEAGLLSSPYPSATATFEHGTLAYLTRRKATHTAPDGATLYEFGVIGHGPDADTLVEKFTGEVQTWNDEYRARPVAFSFHPLAGEPIEQRPGRFTVDTAFNRLLVEWQ
ncbi:hypothetical protein O1L60_30980 [Streptomyces diastatochromogenes]|nr:hypothetical protein [Streptomyces diastatochromogenes]